MKKYFSIFLVLAIVATVVGCSWNSHHGHAPANAGLSSTRSGTVRDDGSLAEISFASGAKVNAAAGTMQPNVVVTVIESKTSEIGANPIGTPSYIYIYIQSQQS